MCTEGMVSFAILALAVIFTLPGALRRQKLTISAWEPIGHSMSTSDAWRHRDSMEHEPWRLVLVRSGWTHGGHWIRQRAMHGDTFQIL